MARTWHGVKDSVTGLTETGSNSSDSTDLVIASFTTGPGATTLPMLIFSKVRLGVSPDVNALATIIVLAVGFAVAIAAAVMFRTSRRQD